jgi:hypothetical protein
MKKLSDFSFGVLLTLSIVLMVFSFYYADSLRTTNATGGEIFTTLIPIWLIRWNFPNKKRNEVK